MGELRICFVGDSFVSGTGDPEYLGWTGRLCAAAKRPDLTYYNLGVRSETSVDIARRWLAETECRIPTAAAGRIVFSFGVNDTTLLENQKVRVEATASAAATRQILTAATARYPVLFVGPPPVGDRAQNRRIVALGAALAEICRSLDVPYLETFTALETGGVWQQEAIAGDGAHPQAAGYAALAAMVWRWEPWQAWLTL